jgi:hypothetical protein
MNPKELLEFYVKQFDRSENLEFSETIEDTIKDFIHSQIAKWNDIARGASELIKEQDMVLAVAKSKIESLQRLLERGNNIRNIEISNEILEIPFYDENLSLAKKAEFVLNGANRELTTREIIHEILKFEPDYYKKNNINFDRFQKNLGSTLKQKIDKGQVFFRIPKDSKNSEFIYGLLRNKKATSTAA